MLFAEVLSHARLVEAIHVWMIQYFPDGYGRELTVDGDWNPQRPYHLSPQNLGLSCLEEVCREVLVGGVSLQTVYHGGPILMRSFVTEVLSGVPCQSHGECAV